MTVLVLGGTTESRRLAEQLARENVPAIISVATRYGRERLEQREFATSETLSLRSGQLDETELKQLIQQNNVTVVVDATHPYAEVISSLAADVTRRNDNCTFVRLKRPLVDLPEHTLINNASTPEQSARQLANTTGRILLTTGTSNLEQFVSCVETERIFARILPFAQSIKRCREMHIPSSHIIAMQGPFTEELNQATYRQYEIDHLVSKRSGRGSGVKQKVHSALSDRLTIHLIDRPDLPSPDEAFTEIPPLVNWLDLV